MTAAERISIGASQRGRGNRLAVALLLLCAGCSTLSVRPPVEVEADVTQRIDMTGVQWATDDLERELWTRTIWEKNAVPFWLFEPGFHPSGIVVWRTNQMAFDEAQAMELWRAVQAADLEQHQRDRGVEWQKLYEPQSGTPGAP